PRAGKEVAEVAEVPLQRAQRRVGGGQRLPRRVARGDSQPEAVEPRATDREPYFSAAPEHDRARTRRDPEQDQRRAARPGAGDEEDDLDRNPVNEPHRSARRSETSTRT